MAYGFDGGSDRSLTGTFGGGNLFDGGGSYAFWFYQKGLGEATLGRYVSINPASGNCQVYNDIFVGFLLFYHSWNGGASARQVSNTLSKFSANQWVHFGITYNADTYTNIPLMYFNGVNVATDDRGAPTSGHIRDPMSGGDVIIGIGPGSTTREADANIAEVGFWDKTLSVSEFASLASGAQPPMVAPNSLVAYHPLVRGLQDTVTGNTLTNNNSVAIVAHPPIIQPSAQILQFPSSGPIITSVSTDDVVVSTENPWNITGARFGVR